MAARTLDWDWVSVVGTGQSLAVGGHGALPAQPFSAARQRFGNLRLSLARARVPPLDPTQPGLALIPLNEPLRPLGTTYPSPYPHNLYGQSFHHAMADQITTLVRAAFGRDYVTIHSEVGEAGQTIGAIEKRAVDTGVTGRAYAGSLFEVAAIARLAAEGGKRYGVGAIVLTHGESDASSPTFADDMARLQADYQQDLSRITGQTAPIPMLVTQQHARELGVGSRAIGTVAQWQVAVDHAPAVVCVGPKYQYDYIADALHLTNQGYERLGEKLGQAYVQHVVRGLPWRPLEPIAAARGGAGVAVRFHVPVGPLAWEQRLPPPAQGPWAHGRGFELHAGDEPIAIADVAIEGEAVNITAAGPLPGGRLTVGYAMSAAARPGGTLRWGQLRDSDPFVGSVTGTAQPNHCVAFELPVKEP